MVMRRRACVRFVGLAVFSLALLLSVSPALSFFGPLIRCHDDDLQGFHLHDEPHAHQDRGHVDAHTPEASGHSAGHRHDSHRSHDSNQASDSHSMVVASGAGSPSNPCTCSPVDLPTRRDASLLKTSETNRSFRNLAFGHLASAAQVPSEGLDAGAYAAITRDLHPAGPGLYVINHSFLI